MGLRDDAEECGCAGAALVGICSSHAFPLLGGVFGGELERHWARLCALPHLPTLACARCVPSVPANDNGERTP
jgi:hypothetical protein